MPIAQTELERVLQTKLFEMVEYYYNVKDMFPDSPEDALKAKEALFYLTNEQLLKLKEIM